MAAILAVVGTTGVTAEVQHRWVIQQQGSDKTDIMYWVKYGQATINNEVVTVSQWVTTEYDQYQKEFVERTYYLFDGSIEHVKGQETTGIYLSYYPNKNEKKCSTGSQTDFSGERVPHWGHIKMKWADDDNFAMNLIDCTKKSTWAIVGGKKEAPLKND